jgi:quercetin dioxygenase-like cupin family protein
MTFLTRRGEGPGFFYAGQRLHILAGNDGQPAGFAAMEITIPAHFAGSIPHAHDGFDEAIYVLSGQLQVTGNNEPREAVAGSMFAAPRGHRHGFSNPYDSDALVLGVWAPAEPAIAPISQHRPRGRDTQATARRGRTGRSCPALGDE